MMVWSDASAIKNTTYAARSWIRRPHRALGVQANTTWVRVRPFGEQPLSCLDVRAGHVLARLPLLLNDHCVIARGKADDVRGCSTAEDNRAAGSLQEHSAIGGGALVACGQKNRLTGGKNHRPPLHRARVHARCRSARLDPGGGGGIVGHGHCGVAAIDRRQGEGLSTAGRRYEGCAGRGDEGRVVRLNRHFKAFMIRAAGRLLAAPVWWELRFCLPLRTMQSGNVSDDACYLGETICHRCAGAFVA